MNDEPSKAACNAARAFGYYSDSSIRAMASCVDRAMAPEREAARKMAEAGEAMADILRSMLPQGSVGYSDAGAQRISQVCEALKAWEEATK